MPVIKGTSPKLVQRVLAAVVFVFVLATVYTSYVIVERQSALQKVSRYNIAWTVSQTVSEFMRLEHTLAAYALPNSSVRIDDIQLRLDILFSRLMSFGSPDDEVSGERALHEFIWASAENVEIVAEFRSALEAVDAFLVAGSPSVVDVREALEILGPLDTLLTKLAAAAASYGAARAGEDQADLEYLHSVFSILAIGLIACGIAFIVLLDRQNTILRRAHHNLNRLAEDLRHTSTTLQTQNSRFDAALSNMSQALCTFDHTGRLEVWNDRFVHLVGKDEPLTADTHIDEILLDGPQQIESDFSRIYARQKSYIRTGLAGMFVCELPNHRTYAITHEPLQHGGWLATYEDISERKRAEARIVHMAHHDALTDLPNRLQFQARLESDLRSRLDGDCKGQIAVFMLDLDGFKDVNDTLGHQLGDTLLKLVADRLRQASQGNMVARLGGDEFAMLVEVNEGAADVTQHAEGLIEDLSSPYFVGGNEVVVGLSVGIAKTLMASEIQSEELLRHADLALYQAKSDGKGRARVFEPDLDVRLQARMALENDLRKALERGELRAFYQPLLNAARGDVCGYEALMRWEHPVRGLIPPSDFIHVAENLGIIGIMGEWILREACREAANWPPQYTVAVNLSPVQFRSGTLIQTVINALAASGLAPERLELEITESVLLDANVKTAATLRQLKALGINIAMDDFGTGYSSLSSLRSFPFDKIKIDRSFICDVATSSDAQAVVKLIVGLANELGVTTTAEGVETEGQYQWLKQIGCTQVQGYLFARPQPASAINPPGRKHVQNTVSLRKTGTK